MEEEQRQNPVEETTSEPPASPLELLDETINGEVVNSITQLVLPDLSDKPNKDEPDNSMLTMCHFGVGAFHPKPLQYFASTKFFTFMLCIFGLVEGAVISGFEPVIISSLERRYKFSSTAASVIIIVFDIAVVVSVIIISYFGEKAHKPRWIGIAFVTQGIGALIFALPHFLFGQYDAGSSIGNMTSFESCNDPSLLVPDCDAANTGAYILFLIGNTLIGIAAAPLFTVGVSFIDDIVLPKYVSLHIGAFQVSTIAGPALGFGIGSALLTLYVDVGAPTNLTEDDPAWVGAWWLSFILVAIFSVIGSIPFFFFPRVLPGTHLVTEARQKQMKGTYDGRFGEEKTFVEQLKAFPFHLLGLFKSKAWLFMTIAIAVLFLSLDGLVSFAAKYIESVYRVPPSTAGLIIGAMGIIAGALGTLTGAGIAHCVKIGKNMGIVNWVTVMIAVLPLFGFFLTCSNIDVIGVGTPYTNNSISNSSDVLLASCNVDCGCSSTIFEPVCGADGLTYFSPCRASCQKSVTTINGVQTNVFENCSCVSGNLASQLFNTTPHMASSLNQLTFDLLSNSTAVEGRCDQGCNLIGPFLVVIAVALFLIFMLQVPYVIITVRCVADEQRTLALGLQSLVFRAFGSIPGPIVFGAIFDSACIFWQYDCSRQGSCWVYDNSSLSERAVLLAVMGVTLNFIFSFLSWIVYPKQTQSEKEATDIALASIHETTPQDNSNQVESGGDSESLESSDSYIIQGPQSPPKRRTSNRFESHCSEDILLDHDHTEIDEGVVFPDLHNMRARSVETEVSSPTMIVQPPI